MQEKCISDKTHDYFQYRIEKVARQLETDINDPNFIIQAKTKKRLQDTIEALDNAVRMFEKVDWFLSGYIEESSFNQIWDKEIFNKQEIV